MKHYLLYAILVGVFVLSGCEKDSKDGCKFSYTDYSIAVYASGDPFLLQEAYFEPVPDQGIQTLKALYVYWNVTEYYLAPGLSHRPQTPAQTEEFLSIAARNGDVPTSRKAMWMAGPESCTALSDNFTSLHLTCDTAWDESHPAGAPLDDLVTVYFDSYEGRIADPGCRDYRRSYRLSELPSDALRMVGLCSWNDNYVATLHPSLCLAFDKSVSFPGACKLTLTLTTADGRTKSASIDLDAPSPRNKRI